MKQEPVPVFHPVFHEHLLPHESDWNRFVLGNYDREEDIHKRPLAKLVQDVAKQLGVI